MNTKVGFSQNPLSEIEPEPEDSYLDELIILSRKH